MEYILSFIFSIHKSLYINHNQTTALYLFQYNVWASFAEQRRLMHGKIIDKATLISSFMVLSCSRFEVFVLVRVENPSMHK
jgi:hypothetical protein